MSIELRDFENGLCPLTVPGFSSSPTEQARVQDFIDRGWLTEIGYESAPCKHARLDLTAAGKKKLGIVDAVPVRETQRGLFDE